MKKKNFTFLISNHQGFTLIEILVALLLIVGIFTLIPTSSTDEMHENLENTLFDFERAVRFSENESILRNSLIRLTIDLDSSPQTYMVEFSTDANLILPEFKEEKNLGLKEREEMAKVAAGIDAQFSAIDEFSDGPKKMARFVEIVAVGTQAREKPILEGKAHIYFYPTGEKDAAIIFMATEDEFADLSIPAFENSFGRYFSPFSESDSFNLERAKESMLSERFERWIRN